MQDNGFINEKLKINFNNRGLQNEGLVTNNHGVMP